MFIVALYVSLILFIALSSVFARIERHICSESEVKGAVLSSPAPSSWVNSNSNPFHPNDSISGLGTNESAFNLLWGKSFIPILFGNHKTISWDYELHKNWIYESSWAAALELKVSFNFVSFNFFIPRQEFICCRERLMLKTSHSKANNYREQEDWTWRLLLWLQESIGGSNFDIIPELLLLVGHKEMWE